MRTFDAAQTEKALPFPQLVDAIAQAAKDLRAGLIKAPARQVVSYAHAGTMLSMPATAPDIGVHKLVNVVPANKAKGIPTINGVVSVYDGDTGEPQLILDGPTVTTRRTAAVSMLGIRLLRPDGIRHALIIGSGTQAVGHAQAIRTLYPDAIISILGRSLDKAKAFVEAHPVERLTATDTIDDDADVVIATTTSATPVYDLPAQAARLLVGVGAYREDLAEIGKTTIAGSRLYVDNLEAGQHEAGDYIQAGVDWQTVRELPDMLDGEVTTQAAIYKTVGCSAWDLGAARCALACSSR